MGPCGDGLLKGRNCFDHRFVFFSKIILFFLIFYFFFFRKSDGKCNFQIKSSSSYDTMVEVVIGFGTPHYWLQILPKLIF